MAFIALLPDIHFGVKNNYQPILDKQVRFLSEVFFPELQRRGIKTVISLGDLVDRRKDINFLALYYLKKHLIDKLLDHDYEFMIIPGNHDIFYRHSLEINALDLLLPEKFFVAKVPTEYDFFGPKVLFIPWICNENQEMCFRALESSNATVCMGHFEIDGFEMNKGVKSQHGLTTTLFKNFDKVYSGHYHQRSQRDNIFYTGAACEMITPDAGEYRGFCIFDTNTNEVEYIRNPFTLYKKIFYDDRTGTPSIPEGGFESCKEMMVKVVVSGKNNPALYDKFMTKLEEQSPLDISVVDDHLNVNQATSDDIVGEGNQTTEIIKDFVKQAEGQINTDKLMSLIMNLYQEANQ